MDNQDWNTNQEDNYEDMNRQDMNRQDMNQPQKRMSLGFFLSPLIIDYAVTFLIQIIFCLILFAGVFSVYVSENPEISAYINGETEADVDAYDFFTTEVIDELTDDLYAALDEYVVAISVLSSLAIAPLFLWLMKRDQRKYPMQFVANRRRQELWKYIFIVFGSITLCVALNNLINLSQLAEISAYYEETADILYSPGYIMQLVAYGLLTPFAEELLFRGVLYNRLRVCVKPRNAMIWSAVVFGAYHGNMVQIVYAGICGLVLVWLYERYGSLKAPILAHICMNITSIVLTQYDLFVWIFGNQYRMMFITVGCATITATLYLVIDRKTREA